MHLERIIKIKPYEHAEFLLRRHPLTFIKHVVIFIILAVLPYLVFLIIVETYPWILVGPVAYPILILGASTYYLWIWLYFFGQFVDFYLDVWVVTNDRIINVEQLGLFGRVISELDLYKIQDVTSDVRGMIPTFFNYGNVHIQTAAERERFLFADVARPHDIRRHIIDLVEADRKYHLSRGGHP